MEIQVVHDPLTKRQLHKVRDYLQITYMVAKGVHNFVVRMKKDGKGNTLGQFSSQQDKGIQRAWNKATSRYDKELRELRADGNPDPITCFKPKSYQHAIELYESRGKVGKPIKQVSDDAHLGDNAKFLLDVFGHAGRFKAMCKNIGKVRGSKTVEVIANEMLGCIEEIKQDEIAEAKAKQAKLAKVAAFQQKLLDAGLTVDDLNDPEALRYIKSKKNDEELQKLYRCHTEHGPIEWNGVGRTPQPMVKYMNDHNIHSVEQLAVNA